MRIQLVSSCLLVSFVFAGVPSAYAASGDEIELWVRDRGGEEMTEGRIVVRLDDLPLVEQSRFDAQAGSQRWFRGVSLTAFLDRHPRAADLDVALLHFANGMIVPVPLDRGRDRLDVFVARAVRVGSSGPFEKTFADVPKRTRLKPDPRPITFGGNKVVVSNLAHPLAPDPERSQFSPWYYTDSLLGIELAKRVSWDRQFDAGPEVARGKDIFLGRCQYCHAVRGIGAAFGWDFVDPTPLFEYRTPANLYSHVRFINTLAAAEGAMMPIQKDVVPAEVEALWAWMRAIAQRGPRAYQD